MQVNNLERFLESIGQGRLAVGCCITLGDPAVTEIAADAGLDFCWIDCEHGVLDRQTLMMHLMALRGTNCAPLVRVPACDHTEIKKVIDLGPAGIIVPMVNSAEDAARAVDACRYPPEGSRGCGFRRGFRYGAEKFETYWEASRHDPLVIVQIEHARAVEAIDEILAVPGLDGVCIGPCDLSFSCRRPFQFDDPVVSGMIDEVCRRTREAGLLLGAYGRNLEAARRRGIQWLGMLNDTEALFRTFQGLAQARDAT